MVRNSFLRALIASVPASLGASASTLASDPALEGWIDYNASAYRSIAERITASESLNELTREQVRRLVERHNAFLEVRTRDTADDYIALMLAWGAEFRIDPHSPSLNARKETDWQPTDSPCAWSRVAPASIDVSLIRGLDEGLSPSHGWPRLPRGVCATVSLGVFTFAGGTDQLARAGAPVVQIITPVETADGTRMNFGIRWVWDEIEHTWVPWHAQQTGEPFKSVCVLFH